MTAASRFPQSIFAWFEMASVIAALLVLLLLPRPAAAQSAMVLSLPQGCGTANFTNGTAYLTVDTGGRLCTDGAGFSYAHITTDATTAIKSGGGVLHSICVNTVAASSTITVDDATSATTPTIAVLSGASLGCYTYDVAFANGLTIVTAVAAPDITVSWR